MPEPITTGGSVAAAVKIYVLASVTIASIILVCLVVLLMRPPRNLWTNNSVATGQPDGLHPNQLCHETIIAPNHSKMADHAVTRLAL